MGWKFCLRNINNTTIFPHGNVSYSSCDVIPNFLPLFRSSPIDGNHFYSQADLVDLKEQLRIYESMSKLGARIEDHNDGVKRNLEADEWRTPTQG